MLRNAKINIESAKGNIKNRRNASLGLSSINLYLPEYFAMISFVL